MHVSDDDSNKFCKFDEIWWTLKKCWNFMIFLGPALLWMSKHFSDELSLMKLLWMGSNFYMHVSDDDSNKFCKFDEIWWTLKKCWNFMIFLGPALSAFFYEINNFSEWAQISHACFWWWFNKFCKFDEIWWTLKKCWNFMIFLGPALSAFFCERNNFSEWAQISHACFWWWFQ